MTQSTYYNYETDKDAEIKVEKSLQKWQETVEILVTKSRTERGLTEKQQATLTLLEAKIGMCEFIRQHEFSELLFKFEEGRTPTSEDFNNLIQQAISKCAKEYLAGRVVNLYQAIGFNMIHLMPKCLVYTLLGVIDATELSPIIITDFVDFLTRVNLVNPASAKVVSLYRTEHNTFTKISLPASEKTCLHLTEQLSIGLGRKASEALGGIYIDYKSQKAGIKGVGEGLQVHLKGGRLEQEIFGSQEENIVACLNGSFDVFTGEFTENYSSVMINPFYVNAYYDPSLPLPTNFIEGINKFSSDPTTREYLSAYFAYACTHGNTAKFLTLFYGASGTGKSSFLRVLDAMAGHIQSKTDLKMFGEGKLLTILGNKTTANIVECNSSAWSKCGAELEAVLKEVLGGGEIRAHEKYLASAEIKPAKLSATTNEPEFCFMSPTSEQQSLFRRHLKVTFEYEFEEHRDENNNTRAWEDICIQDELNAIFTYSCNSYHNLLRKVSNSLGHRNIGIASISNLKNYLTTNSETIAQAETEMRQGRGDVRYLLDRYLTFTKIEQTEDLMTPSRLMEIVPTMEVKSMLTYMYRAWKQEQEESDYSEAFALPTPYNNSFYTKEDVRNMPILKRLKGFIKTKTNAQSEKGVCRRVKIEGKNSTRYFGVDPSPEFAHLYVELEEDEQELSQYTGDF